MAAFSREELLGLEPVHEETRVVRFQDVDAAGIVFFARLFEYFHDAYVGALARGGVDLAAELARGAFGLPLAHAEADFLGPMRFGDPLRVAVLGARLGDTSACVGHRIASPDGRPLALGQTVHVAIDRGTFRPMALPAGVRRALGRGG